MHPHLVPRERVKVCSPLGDHLLRKPRTVTAFIINAPDPPVTTVFFFFFFSSFPNFPSPHPPFFFFPLFDALSSHTTRHFLFLRLLRPGGFHSSCSALSFWHSSSACSCSTRSPLTPFHSRAHEKTLARHRRRTPIRCFSSFQSWHLTTTSRRSIMSCAPAIE